MTLLGLRQFLGRSLHRLELRLAQAAGFDSLGPALAVNGPSVFPQHSHNSDEENSQPSFLDSIFWMAAPKKRRTIEVNRCRRRNPNKMIKVKYNFEPCLECGNMKLKHTLCGFCYEKISKETTNIRRQMSVMEGGPLKAPAVESVVLYESEKPSDADQGKRIVERNRKRPYWFSL
nr:Zgc:153328 [Danio rerio]